MKNKKTKDKKVIKLGVFENTKQLGRVISHCGAIEILQALNERPKQYKELDNETGLSSTTLKRVIKELLSVQIIKTMPMTSKKRETHQYSLTTVGIELMKFIDVYEKIMTLPEGQQKVIEIENGN